MNNSNNNPMRIIVESMEDLKRKLEGHDKKVVKTIPMKKEWLKEAQRINDEYDKATKIRQTADNDSKKFWATVQLGLDDFETDKRMNLKNEEIEILESPNAKSNEPGIKSPFIENM